MRMKASVPCSRGGCNTINWSYGTPAGEATARASSAVTPALESRKSTTTISLPMPFILANAWLASALMEFPKFCLPYMANVGALASEVNLKFLSVLLQPLHRNFKFTSLENDKFAGAPLNSEVRNSTRRTRLRTSELEHQCAGGI